MATAYADVKNLGDDLSQPEVDKSSLDDCLDNCGWDLKAINWAFEKVTGESLVEKIITPITGDWSKIHADGDAWRNVGTAMSTVSYNLTANVGTLREHWDGEAAKTHEAYIAVVWKAGLFAEKEVANLIGKGFDKVGQGSEKLGEQAAKLLQYIIRKVEDAIEKAWIPLYGWAKAAEYVWDAYQIYKQVVELIETLKKLIQDVKTLFDGIGKIASALGKIKDVHNLAEAERVASDINEGVQEVKTSAGDIKDDANTIKDDAKGVRDTAHKYSTTGSTSPSSASTSPSSATAAASTTPTASAGDTTTPANATTTHPDYMSSNGNGGGQFDTYTHSGHGVVHEKDRTSIGDDPRTHRVRQNLLNEGEHDVIVHGSSDGRVTPGLLPADAPNSEIHPHQVVQAVRDNPNYVPGTPVRLVACHSGNDAGWAQQVADGLGVPVRAPSDKVGVANVPGSPAEIANGGQWRTYYPGNRPEWP